MATDFNFINIGFTPNNNFYFITNNFNIIAGSSGVYTAIWADINANIETAKMYIGTFGPGAAFSVINLTSNTLEDSYLLDQPGLYNESLEREDIIDINV